MTDEYGPSAELPPFKIIVIGNTGVGKTCLISRYVDDTFQESHHSTLGVDFKMKNIEIDGKKAKLQLWDFAGSDRFANIQKSRFEEAHAIVMVYDLTNQESFEDIERHWGQEVSKHKLKSDVAKILVGNKVDLAGERRIVDASKAKKFAEEYGAKFVETSAKLSTNVSTMFETVARDVKVVLERTNSGPDMWRDEEKKRQKRKCLVM